MTAIGKLRFFKIQPMGVFMMMGSLSRMLSAGAMASMLFASGAYAQTMCSGTLTSVFTIASGDTLGLATSFAPGNTFTICSFTSSYQGTPANTATPAVSPQTCFAWFAVLEQALQSNETINLAYGTGIITSCSSIEGNVPPPTAVGASAPGAS
jgi:hypothetical protein